jgi:hypothetical protein
VMRWGRGGEEVGQGQRMLGKPPSKGLEEAHRVIGDRRAVLDDDDSAADVDPLLGPGGLLDSLRG